MGAADGGTQGNRRDYSLVTLAMLDSWHPVFQALADPQRRAILGSLMVQGEASASELAQTMPVSRQAVVKHLGTLRRASLVTSRKAGRDVLFAAEPAQLLAAGAALQQIGTVWTRTLADLKHIAEG
jgi:DNA-binding transcriptional ArsR family regulator